MDFCCREDRTELKSDSYVVGKGATLQAQRGASAWKTMEEKIGQSGQSMETGPAKGVKGSSA